MAMNETQRNQNQFSFVFRNATQMTVLFSMLLFNAADEVTDLDPIDVSPDIKQSAMKVYRMMVDLVKSGEIEVYAMNSLFQKAMREFIRNLSRMADELLPFVSHFNIVCITKFDAFTFFINISLHFNYFYHETHSEHTTFKRFDIKTHCWYSFA